MVWSSVTDTFSSGGTFTAANEDAVAAAINGLGWAAPCHYATVGTETFTIAGGTVTQIVGNTLDGGSPAVGDRILVKDAPSATGTGSAFSSQPGNGIYQVVTNSSNLALTRVYEWSANPPTPYFIGGAVVAVQAGTANGGLTFIATSPNNPGGTFTWGTTAVQWAPQGYQIGTGLSRSGSTVSLSSTVLSELSLAASSLQSASGVLTASGGNVSFASMATGQVLLGNAGTPTITTLTGDVTVSATGVTSIVGGAVTTAKMANLAAHSLLGNTTGSSATPAAVSLTSAGAVGAVPLIDANGNLTANALIAGATSVTTAGSTTTLTVASTPVQYFTGSATQTVALPAATSLQVGTDYTLTNASTGNLTVNDGSGATLQVLATGTSLTLTLITNSTTAGTWAKSGYVAFTVTSVSVVSANGFAGTVATSTTTPAITLSTTVTGLLKGNGTSLSAAVSGTDYAPATATTSILKGNGSGGFSGAVSGTDYAPATTGSAALKGNGSGGFSAATLNDVGTPTANYSLGGTYTLTNVPAPTTSDQVANKGYVDATAQGLSVKQSCSCATVGTETFTIVSGNVTQIAGTTIDGINPNVNDRILVWSAPTTTGTGSAQSINPGNGIYVVTSNTTNLSLSRTADMSGSVNPAGAFTFITDGVTWESAGFVGVTTLGGSNPDVSFTWGTTPLVFAQFTGAGEITAGTGLTQTGNTLAVSLTGGTGITVSGATISVTSASIGTTQLSATGTKSSATYFRGDNTYASFNSAVGSAISGGTGITVASGVISVTNASIGPTQLSATGTPSSATVLVGNNTWANLASTVSALSLSSFAAPTAAIAWGGYGITSLANPTTAQGAATKAYVDSTGYHLPCAWATTGTETFTISGGAVTQIAGTTLDGASPAIGDRVLVKDAPASTGTGSILSSQAGNGLYTVTGTTTNLSLARVSDMSAGGVYSSPAGSAVVVSGGSANASTSWLISSPTNPDTAFTYGTTAIQWTPAVNTTNVLSRSGTTVGVAAMSTGQLIYGSGGTPTIGSLSGDATISSGGALTIGSGAVSLAKMANLSANSLIGNTSGSSATPTAVSVSTSASAGAVALRDANANLTVNSIIENSATTATAAGTTTLIASSPSFQQFTGTTTQTVVMPNATTMVQGQSFTITNRSTGTVTVEANGATVLQAMVGSTQAVYTLISNSGSAGTWDVAYTGASSPGTVTSVSVSNGNGFTGSVATATSTPAISIGTSITGLLKGNGTAISAATSGTDYAPATSGSSILSGNGSGGFSLVTIGPGLLFSGGTISTNTSVPYWYAFGDTTAAVTFPAGSAYTLASMPTISVVAGTSAIGYLTTSDNVNKLSLMFVAEKVGTVTAVYINLYTVGSTGLCTNVIAGSNIVSELGTIEGVVYDDFAAALPVIPGTQYAAEVVVVGSGSLTMFGLSPTWAPTNSLVSAGNVGGTRPAYLNVTEDAAGAGNTGTATTSVTVTESFTAALGADVFVWATAKAAGATAISTLTATCGGTSMVLETSVNLAGTTTDGLFSCFRLAGAGTGAAQTISVTATVSGSLALTIAPASYLNVGSIGTITSASGSSTAPTVAATDVVQGMVIGAIAAANPAGQPTLTGLNSAFAQRSLQDTAGATYPSLIVGDSSTTGALTFAATASVAAEWAAITIVLKPGVIAPAPTTFTPTASTNIPFFGLSAL